jgi:hypothetical protein
MGDSLIFLPVARQFKEEYPGRRLSFVTSFDIHKSGLLQNFNEGVLDGISYTLSPISNGKTVGVLMDGLLERDHTDESYSHKNRLDIYRDFLELDSSKPVVWTSKTPPVGLAGVLFCSSGTNERKTLPPDTAEFIAKNLERKYKTLIHIGENRRIDPFKLLSFTERARVIVTVDTMPLWLAHFTRTPVVLITGPSLGDVRLSRHPLYPDGVREVKLCSEVGCEPCFERGEKCSMTIKCLKEVPKARVWEMVEKATEEVIWKTR